MKHEVRFIFVALAKGSAGNNSIVPMLLRLIADSPSCDKHSPLFSVLNLFCVELTNFL